VCGLGWLRFAVLEVWWNCCLEKTIPPLYIVSVLGLLVGGVCVLLGELAFRAVFVWFCSWFLHSCKRAGAVCMQMALKTMSARLFLHVFAVRLRYVCFWFSVRWAFLG
jgi:hypothetical protein